MAQRDIETSQKQVCETELEGHYRYAIFYAPPEDDPLASFGARWLGRTSSGETSPRLETQLSAEKQAAATAEASRYGLHGTLKAPFALGQGVSAAALDAELESFAASRVSVSWPGWRLSDMFGFTSLRPAGPCCALNALAAGVVAHFASFGAVLTQDQLARRRRFGLSHRQEAYLAAYGYPYVFEDFAFHVTLSGPLNGTERKALGEVLAGPLEQTLGPDLVTMKDLCLFAEPAEGRPFKLLKRYALKPVR